MEDEFLKYADNKVVNVSSIQIVEEDLGMAKTFVVFFTKDGGKHIVEREYEAEWRKRFDLND